jgi:hypothetical protein
MRYIYSTLEYALGIDPGHADAYRTAVLAGKVLRETSDLCSNCSRRHGFYLIEYLEPGTAATRYAVRANSPAYDEIEDTDDPAAAREHYEQVASEDTYNRWLQGAGLAATDYPPQCVTADPSAE